MDRAIRTFTNAECEFHYRESVFKRHKDWIIFSTELEMTTAPAGELRKTAGDILKIRLEKYPASMKCAGSIFKNLILAELPEAVQQQVPERVIREGKVPSAYFLEAGGREGNPQRRNSRGRVSRKFDLQRRRRHGARALRDHHGFEAARAAAVRADTRRRSTIRRISVEWGSQSWLQPAFQPAGPARKRARSPKGCPTVHQRTAVYCAWERWARRFFCQHSSSWSAHTGRSLP